MREESTAARGILALSVAGILSKVISILYTPLLTYILGDEGYGMYAQVLEVFVFVYAVTSAGAQPAVAKVVSELTALGKKKAAIRALKLSRKFYFIVGTIAGLSMMLLAFPVARLIGEEGIAYGIIVLGPCILITSIMAAYRGFMQGKGNMKPIAISQILEQFLNVIVSLLFAYIFCKISVPFGTAGAQVGTSIGALFACLLLIYYFNKRDYELEALDCDDDKVSDKRILRKIILYSIPIIMSSGLQNFGGLVDMINVKQRLLVAGFTPDYANVLYGFYSRYKVLYGVPLIMVTAISTTALPAISRALILNDKKEVRRKIRFAFRVALAIAIPSAVGLSMVAEPVYFSLFGNNRGFDIMVVGSFILVLMTITQIQAVVLQGINKFYYLLGTFFVGILCKIVLNYIFVGIYEFNIFGVLIGNCFWHLIPAIFNHRKICTTMRMKMSFIRLIAKPLAAAIVMAFIIYLIKLPIDFMYRIIDISRLTSIPVIILYLVVGGFTYTYIMIIVGGIKRSDIESVSPRIIGFIPKFMRMKLK